MNIKKGDNVKIIKGKDRGKNGSVLKIFPEEKRVIIDGLNLFKKRAKPKKQGQKGEVVLVPRPISLSNVMLVCQSCKNQTRIGFKTEGKNKVRYCKKCLAVN